MFLTTSLLKNIRKVVIRAKEIWVLMEELDLPRICLCCG